jgi:hypothetical protein
VVVVANGTKELSKFGKKSDAEVVPLFIFSLHTSRSTAMHLERLGSPENEICILQ